jgi:hypothetical protein
MLKSSLKVNVFTSWPGAFSFPMPQGRKQNILYGAGRQQDGYSAVFYSQKHLFMIESNVYPFFFGYTSKKTMDT